MVGQVKHTKREAAGRPAEKARPARARKKVALAAPAAPTLTPFLAAVRKAVRAIPRGQTRSYGTIAEIVGKPGAARAVVRALHALDEIPWWRVCRAGGKFAPQVAEEQQARLRQEGWKPARARAQRGAAPKAVRPGAVR